ncbi:EamA family transporter [Oscillatoria salina]|uniref:EamA family transporter n=1 Tax=Oscillatoria salina TaxID=331517 RepID=UPI0013BA0039|nr:DMT family transporter [Oscillatoria salina]MBZ8180757.1 EamA family transporter [Oscillatoria salina IIICB1]NET88257.1 EamA family transporter [Kamptonema sp. SIO1D9]
MLWFLFASLTAIFESLKDVTSKYGLKNINEYIVSWALMFFTLPLLLPLLFFIQIPELGSKFELALLIGGSLNIVAIIFFIKAIKISDLSIAIPLIAFTPLFLLITSPLIIGEYPTWIDAIGIFLIVIGSYILNLKEKEKGYLVPLKALVTEKGSKLMLLVAFIWSITSAVDKLGIENSSPTFWAIANYSFIAIAMLPIMLFKAKHSLKQIPQNLLTLIPIGLFQGAAILLQMQAISMTLVAYVISVKRLSALITVLLGYLIFHEQGIKARATGAAVMIAGVLVITIF